MAKLKNIVKQLSEKDYVEIYDSLLESNAEKSCYLLKSLRERKLSDTKIMVELDVNSNAYYTLRSRLNQKIEEYLLQQMESPRTDILRKVANLNEVLFTKKRTISIATLKKLEKELLDYDLASELTSIYKSLKLLHVHTPEYYNYSQLYNRHVAYMLALDKVEDLLAEYFKKYGIYFLTAEENEKLGLNLLSKEIQNVARLYDSHRLYIYKSCMLVFHKLFVEKNESVVQEGEAIEDILNQSEKIFENYHLDPLYFHLNLLFEFLKLEYYNHYKVYSQAEKYYEEVNDAVSSLLTSYSTLVFSSRFLILKLERSLRLGTEMDLFAENESLFVDFEEDLTDLPKHIIYVTYRALSCYYAGKYEEAAKRINNMINEVSLKRFPIAQMEIKSILALQYCLLHEYELFTQHVNSIQRQIRMFGKEEYENLLLFLKILKIATSEVKKDKPRKIAGLVNRFNELKVNYFAPTTMIRMDETFIKKLTSIEIP